MSRTDESGLWRAPRNEITVETPDGVNRTRGSRVDHNLYDTFERPMIQSGDQKTVPTRYPPRKGPITE